VEYHRESFTFCDVKRTKEGRGDNDTSQNVKDSR
jgi:hypothetical protein